MIIEKDCKRIVIKKIHACNRINFSSNVIVVIRPILNFFFFLQKDFTHTKSTKKYKKALKALKAPKAQRHNQVKEQNANK